MHDIEPFYGWRNEYIASEDDRSPFYGRTYSEFEFSNKIYNYYIHPQWDDFESETLYTKLLFVDYDRGFAVLEMMGEWNDAIENDIMFFRDHVISKLITEGVYKYMIIMENVLNFHTSDDAYYEEWYEDIIEEDGWICFVNTSKHVETELKHAGIQQYVHFGKGFSDINWRPYKPVFLVDLMENIIFGQTKELFY